MQIVDLGNGVQHQFPDDASQEEIQAAVDQMGAQPEQPAVKQEYDLSPVPPVKEPTALDTTKEMASGLAKIPGVTLGIAGSALKAGAGKLFGVKGAPVGEQVSESVEGAPLAVDEAAKNVTGLKGLGARAGLGLLGTVPKIAALSLAPESLLAQSVAAGGLFGYDDQGNWHPQSAIIGALMPGIGKLASTIVSKGIAKGIGSGVDFLKNRVVQKTLGVVGQQAAFDAYMTLADSPQLVQEYRQDPAQAKKHIQEIVGQNLAWALLGAPNWRGKIPSEAEHYILDNAENYTDAADKLFSDKLSIPNLDVRRAASQALYNGLMGAQRDLTSSDPETRLLVNTIAANARVRPTQPYVPPEPGPMGEIPAPGDQSNANDQQEPGTEHPGIQTGTTVSADETQVRSPESQQDSGSGGAQRITPEQGQVAQPPENQPELTPPATEPLPESEKPKDWQQDLADTMREVKRRITLRQDNENLSGAVGDVAFKKVMDGFAAVDAETDPAKKNQLLTQAHQGMKEAARFLGKDQKTQVVKRYSDAINSVIDSWSEANIAAVPEDSRGVRMSEVNRPGSYYLITPSTREPGKWQATRFDTHGPAGHFNADSLHDAIKSLSGQRVQGIGTPWGSPEQYKVDRVQGPLERAKSREQSASGMTLEEYGRQVEGERPVAAATKLDDGTVLQAAIHPLIKIPKGSSIKEEGFVTNKGRFVGRAEAAMLTGGNYWEDVAAGRQSGSSEGVFSEPEEPQPMQWEKFYREHIQKQPEAELSKAAEGATVPSETAPATNTGPNAGGDAREGAEMPVVAGATPSRGAVSIRKDIRPLEAEEARLSKILKRKVSLDPKSQELAQNKLAEVQQQLSVLRGELSRAEAERPARIGRGVSAQAKVLAEELNRKWRGEPEKPQEPVVAENATPELPPEQQQVVQAAQRYRIKGSGPQTYTILERLPQSAAEKENGEQPVKVRNEKTGEETTLLEDQLQPVKTLSAEEKAAAKANRIDYAKELKSRGWAKRPENLTKEEQKILYERKMAEQARKGSIYNTPLEGEPRIHLPPLDKPLEQITSKDLGSAVWDARRQIPDNHRFVLMKLAQSGMLERLPGLKFEVVNDIQGGYSGEYLPASRIARFSRFADTDTPIHEFFHHLHRFISDSDRSFLESLRLQKIKEELAKARDYKTIAALERFRDGQISSDEFLARNYSRDIYHLSNDFEFFAWLMTEKAMAEWNKPEARTFGQKIRQHIQSLMNWVKDTFGIGPREDKLWRGILSGKYEFVPEEGLKFEPNMDERQGNLPLDSNEYDRKKLYEEVGVQAATVGGYRHLFETQQRLADELGIGERARALVGMNKNRDMTELSLAEPGGKVNYYDARDHAGSVGEKNEVIRSAYEKVIRNQFLGLNLKRRLAESRSKLNSAEFRGLIDRAVEKGAKAEALEEARKTFVNQTAGAAGRILQQLNNLRTAGTLSDQLQSDLQRLQKLPQFSTAVAHRVDDIVNVLTNSDRGISLLFVGGQKSGKDIADEYWQAFPQGQRPAGGSDMDAYIRLASSVLAANRDLRNQLTSIALIQRGVISTMEVNEAGRKIAQDILNNPALAVKRLATRSANMGEKSGRAEAAWLSLHHKVERTLAYHNALEDAVRLHEAVTKDAEWRQYVNDVMADAGGKYVPDDLLEKWHAEHSADPKNVPSPLKRVFFEFDGKQTLHGPSGKAHEIDFGFRPETAQAAMEDLGKLVSEIADWLDPDAHPENANSPSRTYWEERQRQIQSSLMSAAVWNPSAIKGVLGKGSMGMPEVFYQKLALPQAKLAFLAQKGFDRLFTKGKGWFMENYDPIRSLVRQARKSHDYSEFDVRDYRRNVLNAIAWEFRNGREVHPGDILNGVKITKEDIALLYGQGRAFNKLYGHLYETGKLSGAEGVMELPRILDDFTGGAWGIRKAMEIGLKAGTTLPRKFSSHGEALSRNVHAIIEARDKSLRRLPELALSMTPEQVEAHRQLIQQDYTKALDTLFNDPDRFQNFVLGFMRQRNAKIYKSPSPFEEHYRYLTDLVSSGDPTAPTGMEDIFDLINARTDGEESHEKIRDQIYGEMTGLTERFFKLFLQHKNSDADKVVGQSANRETAFTNAWSNDVGPAYFYDFGAADAGELRGYGTDMGLFAWRRTLHAMHSLREAMMNAVKDIQDVHPEWRREQIRVAQREYAQGEDFRNLQNLEDRIVELDRFINGLGVWADDRAVGAEGIGLKGGARLMSDVIGIALSGPRTLLRVSGATGGGSSVKMANVLFQSGLGRFRSYPAAALSAVLSMMRFGTAQITGWYAPMEAVASAAEGAGRRLLGIPGGYSNRSVGEPTYHRGKPLQLLANIPEAVRAFRSHEGSERILSAIEAGLAHMTDEQHAALRFWHDQKALGMTPDNPMSARIANILAEPFSKGGTHVVRKAETPLGQALQKALEYAYYRPLSVGEAGLALIASEFPAGGYNVTYDAVGRMAAWYVDTLAAQARRTFDTYEKLGKLGQFDFENLANPKNSLRPWEILPTFWNRLQFVDPGKLPSWARPNSTNLHFARELFSTSTDIDLRDLVLSYWKRLAATAPGERGAVEFLAPEEMDAGKADERAKARLRGLISRFVEQTHHAAPSNRPYQLQKAYAFQSFLPFAGWTAQTLKQFSVYWGKAAFSGAKGEEKFDSHAGLMAAALLSAVAFTIYSYFGGDTEARALRLWDRYINHKNTTLKTIDEAQSPEERTEIAVHNITAAVPLVNSTINSLVGSSGYRGTYGFQAFSLDKINALLNYVRGVVRTHDLTYGLDRLAESSVPVTEPIIENLFDRQGFQDNRNAVRALQKFGPQDLVQRRASAGISLPTELTPYRLQLSQAIYSGRPDAVQDAYQAFVQKATELGRPDPEKLAQQTFASLNPYQEAFGSKLSDAQRQATVDKMGEWERNVVLQAEANYEQAANVLGRTATMTKEDAQGTKGSGAGGASATPSAGGSSSGGSGMGRIPQGGGSVGVPGGLGGGMGLGRRISLGGGGAQIGPGRAGAGPRPPRRVSLGTSSGGHKARSGGYVKGRVKPYRATRVRIPGGASGKVRRRKVSYY